METIVQHEPALSSRDGAEQRLLSVIILNHNYGRYLRQCIESVLAQDYEAVELIVVDDGSTDDSRAVIDSYGEQVTASFKQNGGMVSAMNHGFRLAHGEVVVFVDSDDYLLPGALSAHARALGQPGVVRSQAFMTVLDESQPLKESTIPSAHAAEGELRELVLHRGPGSYVSSPNSGNAWSRHFLDQVFPLPDRLRAVGGETFLMDAAPLFGRIVTFKDQPWATYRLHSDNMNGKLVEMTTQNIRTVIAKREVRTAWLESVISSLGGRPRVEEWKAGNWRLLTLGYLNRRISGAGEAPTLAANLGSAFRARCSPVKRAMLACAILCIRAAPLTLSLYIAGRIIKLRFM
jgi:glycosyltransferase involved in cell wall biosynthesis